ncbi:MAG: hypothetical protein A2359_01720 [Candidatus Moranbacteria bacterium RIFOXYB1_FULL_43_19]|nr:MAG: hypothetical protein A2359_01720 [Candidatus Moranbacteria bacterium RIFOXYB1_FULL_43_19]OGI33048.1 MAG: hypothetical protein A2420_04495 [Candidatus Moranbacteria bacterium RIFOXYC1_FULL_44_13]
MNTSHQQLISLQEASNMTPYSADYLGLLIRKGRLEGFKEKGKWYTTREAVERYMRKVAEASYAHQENLNVEVPAEKIKMASVNFRWALILAGVIFVGAVLFGANSYVKSKQDSACAKYKVRKDESGNITIEVGKDEYVRNISVIQGE